MFFVEGVVGFEKGGGFVVVVVVVVGVYENQVEYIEYRVKLNQIRQIYYIELEKYEQVFYYNLLQV